ncbi:MAG TPA: hypothetical protein PKA64_10440 [Myxococcota bacterium]|nr:hypothetical protein [Myxococcota bacterium]
MSDRETPHPLGDLAEMIASALAGHYQGRWPDHATLEAFVRRVLLHRADRTAGVQVISSILGVTVFLAARLGLGEIAGVLVGTKPIPFFCDLFLLILSLGMSLAATITFTGWMERKRA